MKKIIIPIFVLAVALLSACSDILDEQPRSELTPEFFSTEEGVQYGLSAVYSQLRYLYGPHAMMYLTTEGTDEATYGGLNISGDSYNLDSYNITASNSEVETLWNRPFPAINTCNGIIENAESAGVDNSLIAEARFFRAFNYFILVTTFGDAPLDLGSGELAFNTTPSRLSTRDPLEDVYTKCIFPDLLTAINDLPEEPRVTSATNQVVAKHFLAKAYLTYAWWLENNSGTDPDGKSASDYYQLAYDYAVSAIENPGPFSLQSTFKAVNIGSNDYNSEILLCADHTSSSFTYDESTINSWESEPNNHMKSNRSCFAMNMNFEMSINGNKFIYRQAVQEIGRPWRRITPTHEVFTKTFPVEDRDIDTRFDGTFVTAFPSNYQGRDAYDDVVLTGENDIAINDGDTVFYFAPTEDIYDQLTMKEYDGTYEYGTLPDKAYAIYTPSMINRNQYPTLWKFGPYREDDTTPDGTYKNTPSTRPFPIAKLSETYLIAAEASVKGASGSYSARDLVNVIRRRAGMPNNGDAMVAATPATIDIDYILMERSRELYGENMRWYDLTRTGMLEKYAGTYTMCDEKTPVEHTRDIQSYHYLRPIPSSQFDNMDNTDEEKALYQNPGY